MKRVVDNVKTNVIFDSDVIVTSDDNAGTALSTVIKLQNSRISKLESNTKWLYKYGGMGSGSSSGGESATFSSRVTDITTNLTLTPGSDVENRIEYSTGADKYYTYRVRILKPGTSVYRVTYDWQEMTKTGTIVTKSDFVTVLPDSPTVDIPIYLNTNSHTNIVISDPDENEILYKIYAVVNLYNFSISYVDKSDHSIKIDNTNNNLFMKAIKEHGVLVALLANVECTLYDKAIFTYTDWMSKTHQLTSTHLNTEEEHSDEIQSNRTHTLYLDVIDEELEGLTIQEYLNDPQNAGLKYFKVHFDNITVESHKEQGAEKIDDLIMADSLIPDGLYLKILTDNGELHKNYVTLISCYQFTDNVWKNIDDDTTAISAVAHSTANYIVLATNGTEISSIETDISTGEAATKYYKFENNIWKLIDSPTPGVTVYSAISHEKNTYTASAEEGIKIRENSPIYSNGFIAGTTISFYVTPYYGSNTHRNFSLLVYLDDFIKVQNISLFEQEQKNISFLIIDDKRTYHSLTFILTYNGNTIRLTYYLSLRTLATFSWYSEEDTLSLGCNSCYRKGQPADESYGIYDVNAKRQLKYDDSMLFTLNSPEKSEYKFTTIPDAINNPDDYDLIICIGLQNSATNDSDKPLFDLNVNNAEKSDLHGSIKIYGNKILYYETESTTANDDQDVIIPKESNFDTTDTSKYHLITIHSYLIHLTKFTGNAYRSISIYVDGILDHAFTKFYTLPLFTSITCYKGIYDINLLEHACFKSTYPSTETRKYTSFLYNSILQYYYTYDERILGHAYDQTDPVQKKLYENKINLFEAFKQFEIDNENRIHVAGEESTINVIAGASNINTMVIHFKDDQYNPGVPGYKDNPSFNQYGQDNLMAWISLSLDLDAKESQQLIDVNVSWSTPGSSSGLLEILYNGQACTFQINLQGSSTLSYRTKNFDISLPLNSAAGSSVKVFTPNFKKATSDDDTDAFKTFLPERTFTLKADIVDSGHSNNTSVGSFINDNMTMFGALSNSLTGAKYKNYVKKCITGFPILLFLHTQYYEKDKVTITHQYYFLGIYNFNTSRKSYFNLGYNDLKKLDNYDFESGFHVYELYENEYALNSGVRVTEVLNKKDYFDFSLATDSILFPKTDDDNGAMFGDFVPALKKSGTTCYSTFVKNISLLGGYLFNEVDKKFIDSKEPGDTYGYGYDNAYLRYVTDSVGKKISEHVVPNYRKVLQRNNDGTLTLDTSIVVKEIVKEDFKKLILGYTDEVTQKNIPSCIDYRSLCEYYTICMAFGLVDSVQKNLNIKSWDSGDTFYLAFYDMDTCLGINNDAHKIKYFAFSDYWTTDYDSATGILNLSDIYYDYSPKNTLSEVEKKSLYDVPSTYLFAIAKYSAPVAMSNAVKDIFSDSDLATLKAQHPTNIWSNWRTNILKNSDTFIDNYYKDHLNTVPLPAFNLNYCSKYLVQSYINDEKRSFDGTNFKKFNGRMLQYTREWLNNRLHILDAYFNMNSSIDSIKGKSGTDTGCYLVCPSAPPNSNDDVYVLHDIFESESGSTEQYSSNVEVKVKMLPNMPLVVKVSNSTVFRCISPDAYGKEYTLKIDINNSNAIIGGSSAFTAIDSIDLFIKSGNLHLKSKYLKTLNAIIDETHKGNTCTSFADVWLPALQSVSLKSENYGGELTFTDDINKNLSDVDISNSKIQLTIVGTPIKTLIAENMQAGSSIRVTESKSLETVSITGTLGSVLLPIYKANMSFDSKILCTSLQLDGGTYVDPAEEDVKVTISGNKSLRTLTVSRITHLTITDCPSLHSIYFNDIDENKLKSLIVKYSTTNANSPLKVASLTDSVIDLTTMPLLKTLCILKASSTKIRFCKGQEISLGESALEGCTQLSEFEFDVETEYTKTTDGHTKLNIVNGKRTFAGCKSLKISEVFTQRISGTSEQHTYVELNLNNLSSIGGMFNMTDYSSDSAIDNNDVKYFFNNICTECKRDKITNLDALFANNKHIIYGQELMLSSTEYLANPGHCELALDFKNATNADQVFYNTNVTALNRYMFTTLGLNSTTGVSIDSIVSNTVIDVTTDFLHDIIDRLTSLAFYNYLTTDSAIFTRLRFVKYNTISRSIEILNTVNLYNIFHVIDEEDHSKDKHPSKLKSITCFNVYNKLFIPNNVTVFDNATFTAASSVGLAVNLFCYAGANTSLNVVVQKNSDNTYNVDPFNSLFRQIKISKLTNSFGTIKFYYIDGNTTTDVTNDVYIDIYKLIDWTTISDATALFEYKRLDIQPLIFNKFISYNDFLSMWLHIVDSKIQNLQFLFNNAILVDESCNKTKDIYLTRDNCTIKNSSLKGIQYLFDGFVLKNSVSDTSDHYISFTCLFFKNFIGINNVAYAFRNLKLAHTLPYDFFNKRRKDEKKTAVYIDSENDKKKIWLHTNGIYCENSNVAKITNFSNCFENTTILNNSAFDANANYNKINGQIFVVDSYLTENENQTYEERLAIELYYENKSDDYPVNLQHCTEVTDTDIITDFSNATQVINSAGTTYSILNFALGDASQITNKTFIAPDIFYGASENAAVQNAFSNTIDKDFAFPDTINPELISGKNSSYDVIDADSDNKCSKTFTGAIPKHLLKKCKFSVLNNIFRNINILPTFVYLYFATENKCVSEEANDIYIVERSNITNLDTYYVNKHDGNNWCEITEWPEEISPIYTKSHDETYYEKITKISDCYSFVPDDFTSYTELNYAFNFRIIIPGGNTAEHEVTKTTNYYIMLNTSIPKAVKSLKYAFPNRGCVSLFATVNGRGTNIEVDYSTYSFEGEYSLMLEILDNSIRSGIDMLQFTSLDLGSLLQEKILRVLTGKIIHSNNNRYSGDLAANTSTNGRLKSNEIFLDTYYNKSYGCYISKKIDANMISFPTKTLYFLNKKFLNYYTSNIYYDHLKILKSCTNISQDAEDYYSDNGVLFV